MLTRVNITSDGTNATYTVPFPYLNKSHVHVTVNGSPQVLPPLWQSESSIKLQDGTVAGDIISIFRQTPSDGTLVDFTGGASLNKNDLNISQLQTFYLNQELLDMYTQLTAQGFVGLPGGGVADGNPQTIIDNITQNILASDLLAELNGRISDIDTNAESLIDQELRINSLQDAIDALGTVDGTGIGTFLLNEQDSRISGDQALQDQVDLMGAVSGDGLAFVLDTSTVMVDGVTSLASRLSGLQASIGSNTAAIAAETTARASADSSQASTLSTLSAASGTNTANIAANTSAIASIDGTVAASYTLRTDVNGYISGFGLMNTGTTSQFIILVDQFAIVSPGKTQKAPFVVGTVNGATAVGIDGTLVVDGSIKARHIDVTTLDAISASMGTLTGGLFRTASSGYRMEMGNDSTWPLWYGTGSKSATNGLFFVDKSGNVTAKNFNITGNANTQTGTVISGSVLDVASFRIDTGGGRRASPVIEDMVTDFNSPKGNSTVTSSLFLSPNSGTGYSPLRMIANQMDVYFDIFATGDGTTETLHLQRQYDGGSWTDIAAYPIDFSFYGSGNIKVRYTTATSWSNVKFRVTTSAGLTLNLSMAIRLYNFGSSSNSPQSVSSANGTSGRGSDPLPPSGPPGTYVP